MAPLDTKDHHFAEPKLVESPAPEERPAEGPITAAGEGPVGKSGEASFEGVVAKPRPATLRAAKPRAPRSTAAKPAVRSATPTATTAAKKVTAARAAGTATAPKPGAPRVPRKPALRATGVLNAEPAKAALATPVALATPTPVVLQISGLFKKFGLTIAVDGIDLEVHEGSFYGIVGPNGAGKTTLLSMATGLLRPDAGTVRVNGVDVWSNPDEAKRLIGVLPDRLRLFDRLTGAQLLHYAGTLRGLGSKTVQIRSDELAEAFGLSDALGRLVSDYSAGMSKKIALAASLIHSPRLLILDEPFESVDPVSAENLTDILKKFVAGGGTVVLSSHGMDMIQRVCDSVAIIVHGAVIDRGSIDEVRRDGTLQERFVELAGADIKAEGLEWLLSSSN